MTKVFISYVREDQQVIDFICQLFALNGIEYWLDRNDLIPGQFWKKSIEDAIRQGAFFVSFFSRSREARQRSFANEELVIAIEELRLRPLNGGWFIPVRIDDCNIENRPIGGGMNLLDINYCELTNWNRGVKNLFHALKVDKPILDPGEPLGKALPSYLEISGGYIRYDYIQNAPEMMQGMEVRVTGGWCTRRPDNMITAYIETSAPFKSMQEINQLLGFSGFHASSSDGEIFRAPSGKTKFEHSLNYVIPAGTRLPNFTTSSYVTSPFEIEFVSTFVAIGALKDEGHFNGDFTATGSFNTLQGRQISNMSGAFELVFK